MRGLKRYGVEGKIQYGVVVVVIQVKSNTKKVASSMKRKSRDCMTGKNFSPQAANEALQGLKRSIIC